jgi:hypothetical protein
MCDARPSPFAWQVLVPHLESPFVGTVLLTKALGPAAVPGESFF